MKGHSFLTSIFFLHYSYNRSRNGNGWMSANTSYYSIVIAPVPLYITVLVFQRNKYILSTNEDTIDNVILNKRLHT